MTRQAKEKKVRVTVDEFKRSEIEFEVSKRGGNDSTGN